MTTEIRVGDTVRTTGRVRVPAAVVVKRIGRAYVLRVGTRHVTVPAESIALVRRGH